MRIPESVKVGPFTFTVHLQDDVRAADGSKDLGQCRYGEQCIVINTISKREGQETVFLHELLHAVDWMMQAGLKEKQIDRMATGLTMVMRDNGLWREEE